jgi:hypothetical protein
VMRWLTGPCTWPVPSRATTRRSSFRCDAQPRHSAWVGGVATGKSSNHQVDTGCRCNVANRSSPRPAKSAVEGPIVAVLAHTGRVVS